MEAPSGELSPTAVEANTVSLWKEYFTNDLEADGEAKHKPEVLLSQILETHYRLHQMPKMHRNLCEAVKDILGEYNESSSHKNFRLPSAFLKQYAVCVEVLSKTQVAEIWDKLLNFVEEFLLYLKEPREETGMTAIDPVVDIFSTFLRHIFGVHESSSFELLMKRTRALTKKMLSCCKHMHWNQALCSYTLSICMAFGDILLLQRVCEENTQADEEVADWKDITFLHSHLSSKKWLQLVENAMQIDRTRMHVSVNQIMIQKVKSLVLSQTQPNLELVHNTFASMLLCANVTDLSLVKEGDDSSSCRVDAWRLLLNNLSYFLPFVDDNDLHHLCSDILDVCMTDETRNPVGMLKSITEDFLESTYFVESKKLQSAFVTSVMTKSRYLFKLRKRKSGSDESILEEGQKNFAFKVLSELQSSPSSWIEMADDIVGLKELWKRACIDTNAWLSDGVPTKLNDIKRASSLVKLLNYLPLEYLSPGNQFRCLLLLLMLILSPLNSNADFNDEAYHHLFFEGTKISLTILNGARSVWLFPFVDPKKLLERMIDALPYILHGDREKNAEHNFWDCGENLLHNFCRLALRSEITFPVNRIKELMNKIMQDDSSVSLLACRILFEQLLKVIIKVGSSSERRIHLCELCENLSSSILVQVSNAFHKKRQENENVDPHQMRLLLEGFVLVLRYSQVKDQNAVEEVIKDILKQGKVLRRLISVIIHKLSNDAWDNADDFSDACLKTLKEVFILREHLGLNITSDIVMECWDSLSTYIKNRIKILQGQECVMDKDNQKQMCGPCNQLDVSRMEQSTIASVLEHSKEDEFQAILDFLHSKLESNSLEEIRVSLLFWTILVQCTIKSVTGDNLSKALHKVLPKIHNIVQSYEEHPDLLLVVLPSLDLSSAILKKGRKLANPAEVLLCVEICTVVPLKKFSQEPATFCHMFESICSVLDQMFIHHEHVVLNALASVVSYILTLIRTIIETGNEENVSKYSRLEKQGIESCAQHIERFMTMIASYKKEVKSVAPYLVVECISGVQHVVLNPIVKTPLFSGVYKLLPFCTEQTNNAMQAWLSQGGREIFKSVYADFLKYHKYKGRV